MIGYLQAHWRGEHHVGWSLFVNGVAAYALGAVLFAGLLLERPRPPPVAVALSVALLLAVFVWSWVGMVRSAVRTLRDGQAYWGWKAVAILALVLVAVFVVAVASDIGTVWSQIE
jgi:hypothetical protein